jgi:hypothetical protein
MEKYKYICEECKEKFRTKYNYVIHLKKHDKEKKSIETEEMKINIEEKK